MVTLEKAEYISELLVLPEEKKKESNSTANSTNLDESTATNSTEEENASEVRALVLALLY